MEPQNSNRSEDSPERLIDELNKADNLPDATQGVTEGSQELFEEWERQDSEVHSFTSLAASREYNLRLIRLLPDYKRLEMIPECVKQELKLQESIRSEDFTSHDISSKLRRYLTWFFSLATGLFLLLFLGILVGEAAFKWQVDKDVFNNVSHLLEIAFAAGLIAVFRFFFESKKTKRPSNRN